jgi:hypothetical protein
VLWIPVSADISLVESGRILYTCELYGCNPTGTDGVGASIFVNNEATPVAGQTLAEWVSLDDFNACCPSHYWAQTGYVIGALPDGTFSSQPVFYTESNLPNSGNTANIYTFHNKGAASFGTWHSFRVWSDGLSPSTTHISIGGVLQDSFTQSYFLKGEATGALEAHSTLPPPPDGNGHWTSLQFYNPACYVGCGDVWKAWGSSDGNSLAGTATSGQDFYSCGGGYGVTNISTTEFEAGGPAPACGGGGTSSGGGTRKYFLPVVASQQLLGPGPNGGAPEGQFTINPITYWLLGISVAAATIYGAYKVRKHRMANRNQSAQDQDQVSSRP